MNILVVDDEKIARDRLVRMVEELPGCHLAGQARDGIESVYMSSSMNVDLVLMDIRMPRMSGIEAAKHITASDNPPIIVFITAFTEHALDAFRVHAENYILKPVRRNCLLETLERAQLKPGRQVKEARDLKKQKNSWVCCRSGRSMELVPLNNIYLLRSEEKYTVIYHTEGKTILDRSLISLEKEYASHLIRAHRNALVNKNYIKSLSSSTSGTYFLTIKNLDNNIRVSRRNLSNVRNFMKTFPGLAEFPPREEKDARPPSAKLALRAVRRTN